MCIESASEVDPCLRLEVESMPSPPIHIRESCEELALDRPFSEATLRRRLGARGVVLRQGPSYARSPTGEENAQRARTRQVRMLHASPNEGILAGLLIDRGEAVLPQAAIGPYNVDLALTEPRIAVEVHGGGYGPRARTNRPRRIEYLRGAGWHVVEILTRYGRPCPVTGDGADYLVAFAQEARRKPSAPREHRVVWADGSPYAGMALYADSRAGVSPKTALGWKGGIWSSSGYSGSRPLKLNVSPS
jgi:very-short-patch-repair endonuclease